MRLLATLVLALALFPATASARELWVDPARGSNRAPGTSAAPLRRRAGRASLPDMNVFDVRALVLDGSRCARATTSSTASAAWA